MWVVQRAPFGNQILFFYFMCVCVGGWVSWGSFLSYEPWDRIETDDDPGVRVFFDYEWMDGCALASHTVCRVRPFGRETSNRRRWMGGRRRRAMR